MDEINNAIKGAALGSLKGILEVVHDKLVSVDFNHIPASASFPLDQTRVMDGNFVFVMAWYDNEWGFSNRMADTAVSDGQAGCGDPGLMRRSGRPNMKFRTLDGLEVRGSASCCAPI